MFYGLVSWAPYHMHLVYEISTFMIHTNSCELHQRKVFFPQVFLLFTSKKINVVMKMHDSKLVSVGTWTVDTTSERLPPPPPCVPVRGLPRDPVTQTHGQLAGPNQGPFAWILSRMTENGHSCCCVSPKRVKYSSLAAGMVDFSNRYTEFYFLCFLEKPRLMLLCWAQLTTLTKTDLRLGASHPLAPRGLLPWARWGMQPSLQMILLQEPKISCRWVSGQFSESNSKGKGGCGLIKVIFI